MARSTLARVMPEIIAHEGGFVDHPSDPGGATKYGITIATLSTWRRRKVSKAEVRALTTDEAARILEVRYWKPVKGDLLPPGVDYAVFDFAINSGPSRAVKHLQGVLGAKMDGIIGPETLRAVTAAAPAAIIVRICDARIAFLRGLSTWRTFGKGWTERVAKVKATSLQLASDLAPPAPEDSERHISMAPPPRNPAAFQGAALLQPLERLPLPLRRGLKSEIDMTMSQPWYESRTVWASIITIVGSLLVLWGIEIDAVVKDAIVTLLVVAGPSVAIWGRFVARKVLSWG